MSTPQGSDPHHPSLAHAKLHPRGPLGASQGTFGYGPYFYVGLLGVLVPGFVLLLRSILISPQPESAVLLFAALLLLALFLSCFVVALRIPHRLLVDATTVTATYLTGRRRSWPRSSLSRRVQPDALSLLYSAIPIQDASGAVVFRVLTTLVDSDTFFHLLGEPIGHPQDTGMA